MTCQENHRKKSLVYLKKKYTDITLISNANFHLILGWFKYISVKIGITFQVQSDWTLSQITQLQVNENVNWGGDEWAEIKAISARL